MYGRKKTYHKLSWFDFLWHVTIWPGSFHRKTEGHILKVPPSLVEQRLLPLVHIPCFFRPDPLGEFPRGEVVLHKWLRDGLGGPAQVGI